MKRGEIWWANLPHPAGRRPVILLSRDEAYMIRELVIVAPVTTRIRDIPSEVPLDIKDGLPRRCVANLDIVTTINRKNLDVKLSTLSREKLKAVDSALHFALGMED